MTYFITEAQRKASHSTCYFEFQKGKHKNKFWKVDSICLHMDIFEQLGLYSCFASAIPNFCYFGITHVTPAQYETLKAVVLDHGGEAVAAIMELDAWVQECFQNENCFTVLGI